MLASFLMLPRETARELLRLLTTEFESVTLLYFSSSVSYSVSVTLEETSMPSLEIYTHTVSHICTRSASAISSYPGVSHNCRKSMVMSTLGSVRVVVFR